MIDPDNHPGMVFGLGRIHHVVSARKRERIILGALDAGFTQFDLAPPYGDGMCEAEAGRVLKGRRSEVRLATKVGIPCSTLGARNSILYYASKVTRKLLSSNYGSEYAYRNFSTAALRASLETSLRHLRTDYLDSFFLHEPRTVEELRLADDAREVLERLVEEGKILGYGISASTDVLLAGWKVGPLPGRHIQFELSPESADLVARLDDTVRLSCFGIMRYLKRERRQERVDYTEALNWFWTHFPRVMPVLATNDPRRIAQMAAAMSRVDSPAHQQSTRCRLASMRVCATAWIGNLASMAI